MARERGLYGVTAYSTSQRPSEFGLRAALGAEPVGFAVVVLVATAVVASYVPARRAAKSTVRGSVVGLAGLSSRASRSDSWRRS